MQKQYLTFKGNAVVVALGKRLKDGDRFEITPEQAKHFDDPRAKQLGFKIIKSKENDKKQEKGKWYKK